MAGLRGLVLSMALGVLLTAQTPATDLPSPVSLAKIRQALADAFKTRLAIPEVQADFKVSIDESERRLRELVANLDFTSPHQPTGPPGAQPLFLINLTPVAETFLANASSRARLRAEYEAWQSVQAQLAAFCATHDCPK